PCHSSPVFLVMIFTTRRGAVAVAGAAGPRNHFDTFDQPCHSSPVFLVMIFTTRRGAVAVAGAAGPRNHF
ncbi:hypothetical protein CJ430_31685, partial [Klebsiella pneumoniae]